MRAEFVGKPWNRAFWIAVGIMPFLIPVVIGSMMFLLKGHQLDGLPDVRFNLAMFLAIGSFVGMFVVTPMLAFAGLLGLIAGAGMRSRHGAALGASLLLTGLTLAGTAYWFWHFPW
jgi:hypothetical protein